MSEEVTTVAKCKLEDGEAVAVRAYDDEEWCFGILDTLSDGQRGLKTTDRPYVAPLDPRNQIRKQTFKTYTQIIHVREDGTELVDSRQEVVKAPLAGAKLYRTLRYAVSPLPTRGWLATAIIQTGDGPEELGLARKFGTKREARAWCDEKNEELREAGTYRAAEGRRS